MKKWRIILPVAIAAGFWACGDENSTASECVTEQCLIEKYGQYNADSANAANQQNPNGDSIPSLLDPNSPLGPNTLVDPNNPQIPNEPASSSDTGIPQPESSDAAPIVGSSSSHHHWGSSSSEATLTESSSSEAAVVNPGDTFKEDFRDECPVTNIPNIGANAKLPDPFTMFDGSAVTTKDRWKCRREEIAALLEKVELGEKPRNPEKVEGSYSGGSLKVTVTDKGKTLSFSVKISGAGTKDTPKPAIIGFSGGSLDYSGLNVATISFNQDNVTPEKPRGSGEFYNMYGSNHSAGSLIAWAWGISRLIDALEKTPEAGIDVHHLGVTGCSRLGKGAAVAGAFDARIALVIPQESGSGGASNWRSAAKDSEAQPLSHACQEAAWFRSSLCNYGNRINDLPTDHHYLTGMVAPRALLVLDNTGWVWLGEGSSYANAMSTVEIFKALGAEKDFTYSKAANHMHCSFPVENKDELTAFVKKYLFDDKTQNTGKIEAKGVSYNAADWQDWTTPTLN
ncbi:hypothetical protein [uncultured Fibrobacter sp.]|uniref:glucuronyl esterase domain-containing protein n=1 Tax=uncultured Fibrobacter sp. TaxID=261512 RepID=UPI0025D50760|nr:hypothetical protein [uncultured Fibrobacter sp.]